MQRLGDMPVQDASVAIEIGDRASHLEDAVIAASRELQLARRGCEEFPGICINTAVGVEPAAVDVCVARDGREGAISHRLTSAREFYAFPYRRRRFSLAIVGQYAKGNRRHAYGHVDPIGQRTRNARLMFRDVDS